MLTKSLHIGTWKKEGDQQMSQNLIQRKSIKKKDG